MDTVYIARDEIGRLHIGKTVYQAVVTMLNDIVELFGITDPVSVHVMDDNAVIYCNGDAVFEFTIYKYMMLGE